MTNGQKAIKYFAICFGIFLIVSIVGGILNLIGLVTDNNEEYLKEMKEVYTTENISKIKDLKIDLKASRLTIENGNALTVSSNNQNVNVTEKNGNLQIKEKNHSWNINSQNQSEVVITVPSDYEFLSIVLDAGAGVIDIKTLNTKDLDLDLGAGTVNIDNLNVYNTTEIDGGAGKMTIQSGYLNNLDFDMGVGESIIKAKIEGNSEIDCGVGRLDLNIIGTKDDYTLKISKGIGNVLVDGESISNDVSIGIGENGLKIDGGVGNIEIRFLENNR